jgi:hypothetical protein
LSSIGTNHSLLSSPSTSSVISNKPVKRFASNSLRIVDGKRIYTSMRDCYQFKTTGDCSLGIFCPYEHDNNTKHYLTNVCSRLMRGLCRNDAKCSLGEHVLLPHQHPVCDYYLRMMCAKDNCPYLHVKHTDSLEPCVDFNRGLCKRGILCENGPHRYYYSIIKSKCKNVDNSHANRATLSSPTHTASQQTKNANPQASAESVAPITQEKDMLLRWIRSFFEEMGSFEGAAN